MKIAKSETLVRKHTYWRRTKLAHNFAAMLNRSKHTKVCEICDAVRDRNMSQRGTRQLAARVLQDDRFVPVDV